MSPGYYTIGDTADTKFAELPCDPGWYCQGGLRFQCNAGFWGGEHAQTEPTCSGRCESGYYCEQGSTSPTQFECGGPDKFCVDGSPAPKQVFEGAAVVCSVLWFGFCIDNRLLSCDHAQATTPSVSSPRLSLTWMRLLARSCG